MKIKLDEGAFLPTRAYDDDGGLDLYAREDKVVPAGGSCTFDTGVHVELENVQIMMWIRRCRPTIQADGNIDSNECCEPYATWLKIAGFLKSKSGLMVNHDITSDGLVDYGYTGSIHVKLFNHGSEDYYVRRGDKISQLVIVPVLTPTLEVVDKMDETERGENGFGSTGR